MAENNNKKENGIIKKISFVGIFGNIVLAAFKLFAGIYGKSGAMISDAVHSMSDVFATFIAFIGVKLSKQSADKMHPYGHERMECVASLILGLILFVTGAGIGKTGVENILSGNYGEMTVPEHIHLDTTKKTLKFQIDIKLEITGFSAFFLFVCNGVYYGLKEGVFVFWGKFRVGMLQNLFCIYNFW